MSPDGTVLDPEQIWISTAANAQDLPDVASDGQDFLVAWQDERVTGFREIYAARVSADGAVLDPDGIPVSTGGCCRFTPAIAFGGGNYLVVWVHPSAFTDIRGSRVTPGGTVLDPSGIPISVGGRWHWEPAVASNGTDSFVVWWDQRSANDVYGTRVTADGTVLDPDGILISSGHGGTMPAIAYDGVNYLVAWEDERSTAPSTRRVSRPAESSSTRAAFKFRPEVAITPRSHSTARTTWSPGAISAAPCRRRMSRE